jgi:SNF2 family DNA or RNA helicase
MRADAVISQDGKRIDVHTSTGRHSFEEVLAACKRVPGARFRKSDKTWHYPLAVDTCLALRQAFGPALRVGTDLSQWYRVQAAQTDAHRALAKAGDASLTRVPAALAGWLRPYQRAGALWIANAYRNGGIVADTPGLGKTAETIAGLLEADVQGPVLVACPRPSVKRVWGAELARHAPDVPVYLCQGTRAQRQKVLARFAADVADAPHVLRVVVVVAEMLRVELGDPCYTTGGNKIAHCPHLLESTDGTCPLHQEARLYEALVMKDAKRRAKDQVSVGFSFPELFNAKALGGGWAAVILDESHKLLGSLTVAKGNLMGKGLKLLPERTDARRYALSGTPFGKGGRVQGMFGTLNWLWPDEYTSFWRWAMAHFVVEEKVINRAGATAKEVKGLKGVNPNASEAEQTAAMEEFLRTLGARVLRRTKAEVLPELPPKNIVEIVCDMTPQQTKQYKAFSELAEAKVPGGVITANGGLALLTRERQVANGELRKDGKVVRFTGESGKLDRLWEKLEEHGILEGTPGVKLVIASEFTEFLDAICGRLKADKVRYLRIDGKTSDANRDAIMEQWQATTTDALRVLVVSSKAAGISITLDAADEMHIMDEMWNPEENEQLEDRIHRASRMHQVTILYYRTEGTVDYAKAHSVEMKRRAQHAVLDGSRGAAYLREMMVDSLALKEKSA